MNSQRPTETNWARARPRAWRVWMGELHESFLMAMTALVDHKLRSALTLLGVLVGVFSIIVVMTAMRVMQRNIENELNRLGNRTFVVQKWPATPFAGPGGFEKVWRRKNITYQQGEQLRARATLAASVGIESWLWSGEISSRFASTPPEISLIGETAGSFPAKDWMVREGRPLLDSDLESSRDVCVLGHSLAKTLFPFSSGLGEHIRADAINYTVIGVLESKGATQGGDQDNFALVPLTTGFNRYGRSWRSLSIFVQAREAASYEDTLEQARGLLRTIRKVPPGAEDDFEVFSSDSMIAEFNSFTRMVRLGIAAVSSIALLAAGIGIMNIMLVSVTERTREIGVRRAVGAKKRAIMTQFILEAVILCEVGGVAGVLLGLAGGNAAAYFLKARPVIPFDWVVLGLVICSLVGTLFGTYPAYKAATIDPIDALRYE
jgi:putative ABC transport system permease protein